MNILFIGPPGSGKGTQSQLLQERFGVVHLSTGDMFRAAISKQTEVGMRAKSFMDKGEYVPDSVVIDLIDQRLREPDCKKGFILDGFPRTAPQADALDALLGKLGMSLSSIFYFKVPNETLVTRLSSRKTCRNCGRILSSDQSVAASSEPCPKAAPAVCDFYQRTDDQPEVVAKRIQIYETQTAPILAHYRAKKGFLEIDGSSAPSEVFNLIQSELSAQK